MRSDVITTSKVKSKGHNELEYHRR